MSMNRVIPILVVLILVPGVTAAQDAEEQIQNALNRASAAEIPTSLLESKLAEGRAKGLPMDRIAHGVERRLEGLTRAQRVLGEIPDVSPADLEVGADALEAGVSEAVLVDLAETAPGDRRTAAIAALGYLVGSDVVPEEALDRVQEALARGPEALQNLPAGVPATTPGDIPLGVPAPGGPSSGGGGGNTGIPSSDLPGGPPGG